MQQNGLLMTSKPLADTVQAMQIISIGRVYYQCQPDAKAVSPFQSTLIFNRILK